MLNTLKQLWGILTPFDKRKLLLVLALVIVMAIVEAVGVLSIMPFLTILANPDAIENNILFQKIIDSFPLLINNSSQLTVYLGISSLFIVILSALIKILTQYLLFRFSNLQRHYFSTRLLEIYLQQSYEFFIERNSSNLVKNILSEVDELVRGIIQPTLFLIAYSIVIISMISILLFYDPIMAIVTASVLAGFYILIFFMVKKALDKIGKSFVEANEARYKACAEVFGGIKDIIINNAGEQYKVKLDKSSRLYSYHLSTKDTLGQIPLHIVETIGYGCIIILTIILVLSEKEVSHILPILGLYGIAAYRMLPAAQNIYRSISHIKFSQNIFENIKNEFLLEKSALNNIKNYIEFENKIQLNSICFAYANRLNHMILDNFSLVINKNDTIGIVGKSGSGKSTLMDIMLGLLNPLSGEILIDNITLTKENVKSWQKKIGYVPQSIYLADQTIAENIAFGFAKEDIDINAVIEAAKFAQIHDFIINTLEKGYDTLVGERGIMLSGGQLQRLGIARALYKQPQILFMDEATSALDVETEQAINDAIQSLSGKKTIVIIAHRESAVEKCDKIIRL